MPRTAKAPPYVPKVGDQLVYVARHNAKPVLAKVWHVTESGRFEVQISDRSEKRLFVFTTATSAWIAMRTQRSCTNGQHNPHCYVMGELDRLRAEYEKICKRKEEEANERAEWAAAREEEHRVKANEAKAAIIAAYPQLMAIIDIGWNERTRQLRDWLNIILGEQ